jgi:hypothetical protein
MFDNSRFPLLGAGYLDPREVESHAHAARARIAREWDKALEDIQRDRRLQDAQPNPTGDSQASSQKPSYHSANPNAEVPDSREKATDSPDESVDEYLHFLGTIVGPTLAYLLGLSRK